MLKLENFWVNFEELWRNAFEGISFELKRWEVLAIVWKSWSWKTTLLKAIAWILDKKSRTSWTLDFDNRKYLTRMIFQEDNLLPWLDVEENLSLWLRVIGFKDDQIKNEISVWLKDLGLDGFSNFLPKIMSLWMRRRVNFLRATICKPDLLLADEPFTSVDQNTKSKLYDYLKDFLKDWNRSCILVTHDLKEAKFFADKIYNINSKNFV